MTMAVGNNGREDDEERGGGWEGDGEKKRIHLEKGRRKMIGHVIDEWKKRGEK